MARELPVMGESERKRKRTTRASHSSSDGDEGDKKRGRPRVEKQDESAADVSLLSLSYTDAGTALWISPSLY